MAFGGGALGFRGGGYGYQLGSWCRWLVGCVGWVCWLVGWLGVLAMATSMDYLVWLKAGRERRNHPQVSEGLCEGEAGKRPYGGPLKLVGVCRW